MKNSTDWVQLQDDVRPHLPLLGKAVDTVVDQEVSNYPVLLAFPAETEQDLALGLEVTDLGTPRGRTWSIRITTLEELVARQVILREKADSFIKVYRNTPNHLCFLIWTEGEARFGFIPRRS